LLVGGIIVAAAAVEVGTNDVAIKSKNRIAC
jgi:hypothetical protein